MDVIARRFGRRPFRGTFYRFVTDLESDSGCGHRHRTPAAAWRCHDAFRRLHPSRGGVTYYGDVYAYEEDGARRVLMRGES